MPDGIGFASFDAVGALGAAALSRTARGAAGRDSIGAACVDVVVASGAGARSASCETGTALREVAVVEATAGAANDEGDAALGASGADSRAVTPNGRVDGVGAAGAALGAARVSFGASGAGVGVARTIGDSRGVVAGATAFAAPSERICAVSDGFAVDVGAVAAGDFSADAFCASVRAAEEGATAAALGVTVSGRRAGEATRAAETVAVRSAFGAATAIDAMCATSSMFTDEVGATGDAALCGTAATLVVAALCGLAVAASEDDAAVRAGEASMDARDATFCGAEVEATTSATGCAAGAAGSDARADDPTWFARIVASVESTSTGVRLGGAIVATPELRGDEAIGAAVAISLGAAAAVRSVAITVEACAGFASEAEADLMRSESSGVNADGAGDAAEARCEVMVAAGASVGTDACSGTEVAAGSAIGAAAAGRATLASRFGASDCISPASPIDRVGAAREIVGSAASSAGVNDALASLTIAFAAEALSVGTNSSDGACEAVGRNEAGVATTASHVFCGALATENTPETAS